MNESGLSDSPYPPPSPHYYYYSQNPQTGQIDYNPLQLFPHPSTVLPKNVFYNDYDVFRHITEYISGLEKTNTLITTQNYHDAIDVLEGLASKHNIQIEPLKRLGDRLYNIVSIQDDSHQKLLLKIYPKEYQEPVKTCYGYAFFREHALLEQNHVIKTSNTLQLQGGEDPRSETVFYTVFSKDNHPGLIRPVSADILPHRVILITQFLKQGSLERKLRYDFFGVRKNLTKIFSGLVYTLDYLHNHMTTSHLDLKPDNILLDDDYNPIIFDLGMATPTRFSTSQQTSPTHYSNPSSRNYYDYNKAVMTSKRINEIVQKARMARDITISTANELVPRFEIPYSYFYNKISITMTANNIDDGLLYDLLNSISHISITVPHPTEPGEVTVREYHLQELYILHLQNLLDHVISQLEFFSQNVGSFENELDYARSAHAELLRTWIGQTDTFQPMIAFPFLVLGQFVDGVRAKRELGMDDDMDQNPHHLKNSLFSASSASSSSSSSSHNNMQDDVDIEPDKQISSNLTDFTTSPHRPLPQPHSYTLPTALAPSDIGLSDLDISHLGSNPYSFFHKGAIYEPHELDHLGQIKPYVINQSKPTNLDPFSKPIDHIDHNNITDATKPISTEIGSFVDLETDLVALLDVISRQLDENGLHIDGNVPSPALTSPLPTPVGTPNGINKNIHNDNNSTKLQDIIANYSPTICQYLLLLHYITATSQHQGITVTLKKNAPRRVLSLLTPDIDHFGVAGRNTAIGTVAYQAPENANRDINHYYSQTKADVYSLGLILLRLLYNVLLYEYPLFSNCNFSLLWQRYEYQKKRENLTAPYHRGVISEVLAVQYPLYHSSVMGLLEDMLCPDFRVRPSIKAVSLRLQDLDWSLPDLSHIVELSNSPTLQQKKQQQQPPQPPQPQQHLPPQQQPQPLQPQQQQQQQEQFPHQTNQIAEKLGTHYEAYSFEMAVMAQQATQQEQQMQLEDSNSGVRVSSGVIDGPMEQSFNHADENGNSGYEQTPHISQQTGQQQFDQQSHSSSRIRKSQRKDANQFGFQ
jgi:hypothetical protein